MLIDLLHRHVRRRYHRRGYQSRFLRMEGCTLHYYERPGSDESRTLVLLHGLGTSSSTWVHVLPNIDPVWNVLAPDLPGFGFSALDDRRRFFRFEELQQSVAEFIARTARHPIVLLGHSLGGWLAARYAAGSKLVRRLILVDNAGIWSEETANQGKAYELQSVRDLSRLLRILWARYPWYFKPFYPAILHDLRKRCVPEFVKSVQRENFLNDDLRNLAVKVDILWGRNDGLFTTKSVEIMKRAIAGVEVQYIEQCGHVPQLEKPGEFNRILRNILREEARPSTP